MPLIIVRNDITKIQVDAIVNAAKSSLLGGGGVDGAIHKAAGSELLQECKTLGGCNVGEAKITNAYNLPCKKIIHTVGPVWHGGTNSEENLLANCYKNSLEIAKQYKFESIAFPLISTGKYLFPKDTALKIAKTTIEEFLKDNEMTVYIVVFDKDSLGVSEKLVSEVKQYIDNNYVDEAMMHNRRRGRFYNEPQFASYAAPLESADELSVLSEKESEKIFTQSDTVGELPPMAQYAPKSFAAPAQQQARKEKATPIKRLLSNLFAEIDESFSTRLIKMIDYKGKTDVEVYKKANIDRKLFSKIKNNKEYKPSKATVLSFCFALELNLDDTKDMLLTCGYALSHSSKFDIIIEYCIKNEIYSIFEVNEILFEFEQNLLSS